jgi:hypothetical protein
MQMTNPAFVHELNCGSIHAAPWLPVTGCPAASDNPVLPTVLGDFAFDHYDAIDANRTISDYESGGQEFESLRARQLAHCQHNCFVQRVGELLPRPARRGSAVESGTVFVPR